MITLSYYTIYFIGKLFRISDKINSLSLNTKLNILFTLADLYFSLVIMLFLLLIEPSIITAIVFIIVAVVLFTWEWIIKKPVATKKLTRDYTDKFYN